MENNKKKLIGRTTFGLALILFGITLVVQTFLTMDVLRYILMLWPLIIISIGVEILYYSNKSDIDTKYDFWGIVLTGLVVFSGIGFSILNYGVNKVLYNTELSSYLHEEKVNTINRYFDSDLNIISLDDKAIKIKIIEDPAYYDGVRATIKYTYKPSESESIFNLLNNNYESFYNFIDIFDLDKDIATLEIMDTPDKFESIEITLLTDSKDRIKTKGIFENF